MTPKLAKKSVSGSGVFALLLLPPPVLVDVDELDMDRLGKEGAVAVVGVVLLRVEGVAGEATEGDEDRALPTLVLRTRLGALEATRLEDDDLTLRTFLEIDKYEVGEE